MEATERQFLLTSAWMFMRHGRRDRARNVCEALSEGEPSRAVEVLRAADFPPELAHAEAVLETRALKISGRAAEAQSRWARYLEAKKGASRQWIT